jgi:hypothetical protein
MLCMHKSFCEHVLCGLLGKFLGVEWLSHRVSIWLIFSEAAKVFPKVVLLFYIPISRK